MLGVGPDAPGVGTSTVSTGDGRPSPTLARAGAVGVDPELPGAAEVDRVPAAAGRASTISRQRERRAAQAAHRSHPVGTAYGQAWATRSTWDFSASSVCWLAATLTSRRASSIRW